MTYVKENKTSESEIHMFCHRPRKSPYAERRTETCKLLAFERADGVKSPRRPSARIVMLHDELMSEFPMPGST